MPPTTKTHPSELRPRTAGGLALLDGPEDDDRPTDAPEPKQSRSIAALAIGGFVLLAAAARRKPKGARRK